MARGSVTKRGDSYRIAVELPPDPATGKRRQRFETFHGSKRDADKRLTELLGQLDGQMLGANPKMTLAQFLERWLQDHAAALAPKTYHRYCDIVNSYIVPHLGNEKLGKVTPSHIAHLITTLRNTKRRDRRSDTAPTLSPQSLLHIFRCLHVAFRCAVDWKVLAMNPMDGVKPPKAPHTEMKVFDVDQSQRFLGASASEGLKWQAFFTVALTAGLRQSELRGLRWADVDLDAGQIRIQQTIQRVPGVGRVTKEPKSASGRRAVVVDGDVVALLRRHRAEQNAERLAMGPLWQDHGLIFASQVGTPLEDKRVREAFARICTRASVPKIRPYDLRHSSASLLLAAGVHPKIVSERLGHSNINLTLTTYSHVLPSLQKDAAETLGRLLRKVQ